MVMVWASMASTAWSVVEAKSRFSELIELARRSGPQTITKNGRPAVVVVAAEEWERRTRRQGNLTEFFANSPLRGLELERPRLDDGPRDVDL